VLPRLIGGSIAAKPAGDPVPGVLKVGVNNEKTLFAILVAIKLNKFQAMK
jgi:hypothetical protein